MKEKAPLYIKINEKDNVAVVVKEVEKGTKIMDGLMALDKIPQGHKIALCDIRKDEEIIRYGVVLGLSLIHI